MLSSRIVGRLNAKCILHQLTEYFPHEGLQIFAFMIIVNHYWYHVLLHLAICIAPYSTNDGNFYAIARDQNSCKITQDLLFNHESIISFCSNTSRYVTKALAVSIIRARILYKIIILLNNKVKLVFDMKKEDPFMCTIIL